jgi:hypothetical protein
MGRELVTKSNRFYCVSIVPDICKTPIGPSTPPIPYTIKGEFEEATGVSRNITSQLEAVVTHVSTVIPQVTGDEPGTAKGVKSGTVGARVQHDEKSSTVSFNGERAVRVGDTVFMNDKNTVGKVMERPVGTSTRHTSSDSNNASSPSNPCSEIVTSVESGGAQTAKQWSMSEQTQPPAYSNYIPQPLLDRVPGGGPARTRTDDLAQVTMLLKKQPSQPLADVSQTAETKKEIKSVGIDGGTSRGKQFVRR